MTSSTFVSEDPLWQREIHQFKHKYVCFDTYTTIDALKVKYALLFDNFE